MYKIFHAFAGGKQFYVHQKMERFGLLLSRYFNFIFFLIKRKDTFFEHAALSFKIPSLHHVLIFLIVATNIIVVLMLKSAITD